MKQLKAIPPRTTKPKPEIEAAVDAIFAAVSTEGDEAVRRFAKEFDGFEGPFWRTNLDADVPPTLAAAIQGNLRRIQKFHETQVQTETILETMPGLTLGRRPVAYERVACYVPGGRAAYPSTVLMTVTLAKLAGVKDIIVVTPNPQPSVLYAAKIAGATRVLELGGAHAVAALSGGTETIPKVDAIVGPGNAYVTEAKRRAECHTDAPAGPSELLILADASANPQPIIWDLLAQAEHDPDAQVVLVTESQDLANEVMKGIMLEAKNCARRDIIEASLENAFCIIDAWDACIDHVNAYAPEHLEIFSKDPRSDMERITNAGSIFLGENTPVSLGDYGSGTNHVLPTMGQPRIRGGLCLDDFRKWITWQEATASGLAAVASDITTLADEEGLQMHAEAVRRRL